MLTSYRAKQKRNLEETGSKEPQWVGLTGIKEEQVKFYGEPQNGTSRGIVTQKHPNLSRWETEFWSLLPNHGSVGQNYPQQLQTATTRAICLLWQSIGLPKPVTTWHLVTLPKLFWASSGLARLSWPSRLLLPPCLRDQSGTELGRRTRFTLTSSGTCLISRVKDQTPLKWKRSVLYCLAQHPKGTNPPFSSHLTPFHPVISNSVQSKTFKALLLAWVRSNLVWNELSSLPFLGFAHRIIHELLVLIVLWCIYLSLLCMLSMLTSPVSPLKVRSTTSLSVKPALTIFWLWTHSLLCNKMAHESVAPPALSSQQLGDQEIVLEIFALSCLLQCQGQNSRTLVGFVVRRLVLFALVFICLELFHTHSLLLCVTFSHTNFHSHLDLYLYFSVPHPQNTYIFPLSSIHIIPRWGHFFTEPSMCQPQTEQHRNGNRISLEGSSEKCQGWAQKS